MISSINFYLELYKIYKNLGLTKKQIWIRLKKLGYSSKLIKNLSSLYNVEIKNGGK